MGVAHSCLNTIHKTNRLHHCIVRLDNFGLLESKQHSNVATSTDGIVCMLQNNEQEDEYGGEGEDAVNPQQQYPQQ